MFTLTNPSLNHPTFRKQSWHVKVTRMITEIFADKPFRPGGGERDRRQCDQPVAELGHQVMMVKIMMMIKLISVMMTMAMMIMIKIIMLLIIRAEERHKLVTASLNFYKTAEQVPTLPTISFPSLLSTSSYHHRAGANHSSLSSSSPSPCEGLLGAGQPWKRIQAGGRLAFKACCHCYDLHNITIVIFRSSPSW